MTELWEVLEERLPDIASGLWVTTRLVLAAFVLAVVLGTLVAGMRIQPKVWLRRVGGVYVEVFRDTPLLVLALVIYIGLRDEGIKINDWTAGIAALGLYTSAYVAETLRSGVFAVSAGQYDASLSLGFTYSETLRLIVLPQAFRTMIAPLGSITIAMIKNSAIIGASSIALRDILTEARSINSATFQTSEAFFWASASYLILTLTVTVTFRVLESRYAIRR